MNLEKSLLIELKNERVFLTVDPFGGAIISFRLSGNVINPLSFRFSTDQMPPNNQAGAVYQGHFACIGRWGAPSRGEINAGLPDHGEPANIVWAIDRHTPSDLQMHVNAIKEGLHVSRRMALDADQSVFAVEEVITNTNSLARPFNIVQHPSLAAPFLNEHTSIDCNAAEGFEQAIYASKSNNNVTWPLVKYEQGKSIDLRKPAFPYNAVFSFVVRPKDEYGWITAFSPLHNLLFGYIWKRADYPWIHLWQHFTNETIAYRGIEFGTAGIHKPYGEFIQSTPILFGERTYEYLDAGETKTKTYCSFIHSVTNEFTGVERVYFADDVLCIQAKPGGADINIKLSKRITSGLQG